MFPPFSRLSEERPAAMLRPAPAAGRFTAAVVLLSLSGGVLAAGGCAHHRANQYAYAPPLAPPVYPQPQAAVQPVASPGPPVITQPAAAPLVTGVPAAAAAPPMPVMPTAGEVPALADGSCPPCEGAAVPAVYEGPVQTTPCQ